MGKERQEERVRRDRGRGWREGEMGTWFPMIAVDFPDVICHSAKHTVDQMFRLSLVEWVYTLVKDQYRSSAW